MQIETYRGFVYPWSMDHIGHMNVQFYTGRFDEATWHFFARLGLTPGFLKENRRGMVALDQRTQYKQEVHSGSLLHITTELLEIRRKTVRFLHRMFNSETGQEVATTELVAGFLDTDARKTVEFPRAVLDAAQVLLNAAPEENFMSGNS
ncbi:MAG TPA: thioesterase family protein [Noviherbaspirillum sp.]|uniref:acyl-CoA thioesterase n=1 Tax=Noviherbaspirillum sp. TaxID=1926288 RepID=UPI002B493C83|nr:thioesterase family protein [Noviherbaspirillum sp.]HJV83941.1 thioesterase family protein [Noviherbaspirillum sp.]